MLSGRSFLAGTNEIPAEISERKLRVVVVDDSPALLEAVSEVLEIEQLADVVGRARNGAEAVQLAFAVSPDLLLMDITMPSMTGLEATALLKQALPGIRIILMSGEETLEMHQLAHAAGADGFIFKTAFPEAFVDLAVSLFPSDILSS